MANWNKVAEQNKSLHSSKVKYMVKRAFELCKEKYSLGSKVKYAAKEMRLERAGGQGCCLLLLILRPVFFS